jgi:hypothetical protein
MSKKHLVSFLAHKKVAEEVPVNFRTRNGKSVSFEATKKVEEPVVVSFTARN